MTETMTKTNRRLAATSLIPDAVLERVRRRSGVMGALMIVHAWAVIALAIAMVAFTPHPALLVVTLPLAVALIGSRQLGLAILMHEGAHGGLAANEKLNLWLSQWLCAYPVFTETVAYRNYHLQHHAHAQTKKDPDLGLSAPFPISPESLKRKMIRDLTGQTGFKQRKAQLIAALGKPDMPLAERARLFWTKLGPAVLANAVLWAILAAIGVWWAYPLLWIVPLLTWQQAVTRLRNIAEHAVLPVEGDPVGVARTTVAGPIARLFLAPYWVNYHAEHHLMMYVPCYNLPRLHKALMAAPVRERMVVAQDYAEVLRLAASKAPAPAAA
jgi:fatty acid desaturase